MSPVSSAFLSTFGLTESRQPHRLHFNEVFDQMLWENVYQDIGAGWFKNKFLQLFCADLEPYDALLEHWHFALPKNNSYNVIGRNSYGALLLIENMDQKGTAAPIRLLNPLLPAFWGDDQNVFMNCIGHWLPKNKIPGFSDSTLYDAYFKTTQTRLEADEILAIKIPMGLGGAIEAQNFQIENIFDYYRSTAPIYAPFFENK